MMTATEFRHRCCSKATVGNKIHILDGSNFADTFRQDSIPGLEHQERQSLRPSAYTRGPVNSESVTLWRLLGGQDFIRSPRSSA